MSEALKVYVDEQVAKGSYGNVSEFSRDLICQDQKRRAKENLAARLLEGLESGASMPISTQDWEQVRLAVQGKIAQQQTLTDG